MFKLASHLGKTVGELESTLTAHELAEWRAYDAVDPIGGYRMDLGFALLARIHAGDKDSRIEDFLVIDPNPMTDEQRQAYEVALEEQRLQKQVQDMLVMLKK
nr:phage tail protein [uncultured Moraxella sp.]